MIGSRAGIYLQRAKVTVCLEEHHAYFHALNARQIITHETLTLPCNGFTV